MGRSEPLLYAFVCGFNSLRSSVSEGSPCRVVTAHHICGAGNSLGPGAEQCGVESGANASTEVKWTFSLARQ